MTPEERERMNLLCRLIQEEKDPKQFGGLVNELEDLLERRKNTGCQQIQEVSTELGGG
jgi:hypothetical protein